MLSLIPIPKKSCENKGSYTLSDEIKIKSDFNLPLLEEKAEFCDDAPIVIEKDEALNKEGYTLCVTPDGIRITAATKIGAYYALQSIRKLGKTDLGKKEIPCCVIEDEPRFAYRGISLDVSRHFFGVDEVKRFLDNAFMQKLNVFHWHLTDDQGWRIEIKKYPLLTEVGSKRAFTQVGGWGSIKIINKPYGGYYTQEQIKEVVAYAKERGITVIPEIDFPAHAAAAIASYNYLACREIKSDVHGFFGGKYPTVVMKNLHWNRTVCCGKDSTFEFIFNVLDEVCELFDAPYIHMGGDEAPRDEWKECPNCKKVMADNGLKIEELQGWFTNKINAYLKTKGKKLIGWNEILKSSNLDTDDKNIVVQYWTPQRDKNAEKYVNAGGSMLMSNHQSFYFDMPYAQYCLKNTYDYRPEKFGVNSENVKNVLGIEGELWTEWIPDRAKLDMMTFPRILALSEVAWSPESNLDYDSFKMRMDDEKPVLDKLGINYAVDKVSMPKGLFHKGKIRKNFSKGNTYLEVELNKEYKSKGER